MRIAALVLGFSLLTSSWASAQSPRSAPPFAAVPCPTFSWTYEVPKVTALPGARVFAGRYDGGLYVVEIPTNWNGELALWAHGNVNPENPGGTALRVQIPALRAHWIKNGFAWAASSYRCNGSVSGVGLFDTVALRDIFTKANGGRAPSKVYLAGQSLGGRVTMLGLREMPESFVGGLAQCPAGQETNDVRVAILAAAELITDVRPTRATIEQDLWRMRQILGKSPDYTRKGKQLASIQVELTGGPRPFAGEGLMSRFIDNIRFGLTNTPNAIVRAATNVDMRYNIADGLGLTAAELNRRVRRKPAEPALRVRTGPFRETAPFDGQLARPLLMIQGTGDLQVPVSQQQAFKRAAVTAGTEQFLVQRLIRSAGHCQFSEVEQTRAFDDLVMWVKTGVRPEGDDVFGSLANAGLKFTDPKRPGDPGMLRP